MPHIIDTTIEPSETDSDKMKPEKAQTKKSAEEIQEKYKDAKKKAAATKDRVSKKISATAATAKESSREAAEKVVHKSRRVGTAVYETVSENLFPVILTGIGAAWLTASIVRSRSESASRRGETDYGISDKAKEVTEKAREATEKAKAVYHRTGEKSKEIITTNPLYVAGALLAVGALIGFAFPETPHEKQLYEEMRGEMTEGKKTEDAESFQGGLGPK